MNIETIERFAAAAKGLLKEVKRLQALSEKAGGDGLSHKQKQKASVNANWQGMEVKKQMDKVHALAVDVGVADARDPEYYEPTTLNPDGWHEYKYEPPKPASIK